MGFLSSRASASLAIPALGTTQLTGPKGTQMLVPIALADAAAIITLPLLDPERVVHSAVGPVAAIAAAAAYAFIGHFSSKEETRVRRVSKENGYALEMRIALSIDLRQLSSTPRPSPWASPWGSRASLSTSSLPCSSSRYPWA